MSLTTVDWIALGVVALTAFGGMRRGLVVSALSLGGLVGGAYAGSRVAPHLLHGGAGSTWTPFVGVAGALVGAGLLQTVAGMLGAFVRRGLTLTPLRVADAAGGLVLGAATGLAFVWVVGAAAVLLPGTPGLRRAVQRSEIVRGLDGAVSPRSLLHLLARIDPFPSVTGPTAPTAPVSPSIVANPRIARAAAGVVKVLGSACGVGIEGTGWLGAPDLVVTAAHVVAGEHDTTVQPPGSPVLVRAAAVYFDAHDDIAVLRVDLPGLRPLPLAEPVAGAPVAIVGYPENGPLQATPGRIGRTAVVLTQDAYGNGPVARAITVIAGDVRHGDSGGAAIDRSGRVESTIFAAGRASGTGYGVPAAVVRRALAAASGPVSTGGCAGP